MPDGGFPEFGFRVSSSDDWGSSGHLFFCFSSSVTRNVHVFKKFSIFFLRIFFPDDGETEDEEAGQKKKKRKLHFRANRPKEMERLKAAYLRGEGSFIKLTKNSKISASSLRREVLGLNKGDTGRHTALDPFHEAVLVRLLLLFSRWSQALDKEQVFDAVESYCDELLAEELALWEKRWENFRNGKGPEPKYKKPDKKFGWNGVEKDTGEKGPRTNRPGDGWLKGFLHRHQQAISHRVAAPKKYATNLFTIEAAKE